MHHPVRAGRARREECNPGRYRVLWDRVGVDETLVGEIVPRVLAVAQPDKIILFGSAATGHMTKDSDIDLLVVEPSPANTRERSVASRRMVCFRSASMAVPR